MMKSVSAGSGIKRRLSSAQDVVMCSFCGKEPAAVSVEMKATRRKAKPTPYCLRHYYATSAVRQEAVTVLDQDIVNEQLKDGLMQQIFAQAFSEVQQELAHESARAFQHSQEDPLGIVGELRGKPKARPKKAPTQQPEGGFIREIPLPERFVKAQQEQARLQREQAARMAASNKEINPYERRKPSRKSIWHIAMQEPTKEEAAILAAEHTSAAMQPPEISGVTCSCGSTKIRSAGNVVNRSSEMTKGETWGSKDRGESLISRYQCESCGRIWNQED